MTKRVAWVVVCGLLAVAVPAQATVVKIGPYGPGGSYNAYALNGTSLTWDNARVAAYNSTFAGVPGHLATIGSAAENALVDSLGGDMWIGLTDATVVSSLDGFDPTTLGTAEFGNTSGLGYPPAGQTPANTAGTQRGEGWAWITGEPVVYQNWGGGEPNNSGDEDAAQIRGDGMWNDHRAGDTIGNTNNNLSSVIEYEVSSVDLNALNVLNYREIKASGSFVPPPGGAATQTTGAIRDLNDARKLLSMGAGASGVSAESFGLADRVNLLDSGGDGRFGSNDKFLLGGDNYVSQFLGFIIIPSAGDWTFGTNTDDGSFLQIGSFTKVNDVLAGAHDHLATFNFAEAGMYPIELIFFEHGGGAEVELFAAQGAYTSFNSSFQLVGDVANGGLAVRPLPEPATLTLLGLGLAAAAWRRRRSA